MTEDVPVCPKELLKFEELKLAIKTATKEIDKLKPKLVEIMQNVGKGVFTKFRLVEKRPITFESIGFEEWCKANLTKEQLAACYPKPRFDCGKALEYVAAFPKDKRSKAVKELRAKKLFSKPPAGKGNFEVHYLGDK